MITGTKAALAVVLGFVLPAAASASCPSYANSGAPLSYTSDQAYEAQVTGVIAGGDIDLSQCGEVPGLGYVVESPDFTMQYDAQTTGRALEIRVTGACDTVLLVNAASGEWLFNDDANGLNPGMRIEAAPSGQYDIWVGTLGAETCEAQLEIETF